MRETWYVLEDGSNADPREVAADGAGVLRHKEGIAVTIGAHGNPRTRSVEVAGDKPKLKVGGKAAAADGKGEGAGKPAGDRQVKSGENADPNYKTR